MAKQASHVCPPTRRRVPRYAPFNIKTSASRNSQQRSANSQQHVHMCCCCCCVLSCLVLSYEFKAPCSQYLTGPVDNCRPVEKLRASCASCASLAPLGVVTLEYLRSSQDTCDGNGPGRPGRAGGCWWGCSTGGWEAGQVGCVDARARGREWMIQASTAACEWPAQV